MVPRCAAGVSLVALLLAPACSRVEVGGSDDAQKGSGAPSAAGRSGDDERASGARALAADPRLELLLSPCAASGPYTVDTADTVAILVANLEHGKLDPLKAAKAELAACGEPCLQEVRRSLDRYWNHPDGSNFVRNALDVAFLADGETARELVVRGLTHPSPGVRVVALRALTKHGTAAEFDRVLEMMLGAGEAFWSTGIPLLHRLDADRAEQQYLTWIETGFFEQGWELFAPCLARSTRAETLAFARTQRAELPATLRPFLAAAAARAGDERALGDLRAMLRDADDGTLRGLALTAAREAELWDELAWSLLEDPQPALRVVAGEGIALAPRTAERDGLLRAASNDADPGVRGLCLRARLERGDAAARDLVLAALGGDTAASLDTGMRVLQEAWDSAPDLPDIAAGVLIERLRDEEHRPLSERARLLHTLGLVPCRRAAEYLVDLARRESGELQKLPVHRWLLLRAGNTGAEGQAVLMERLPLESEPVRRLDYLEALSARGGDAVRELLFALLEDPATQPYEAVYAADRLTRVGPTREVLPALKRAALRMQDYSARTALNCILWTWYPAP